METTARLVPSVAATFPAPGVAASVHRAIAAARVPDTRRSPEAEGLARASGGPRRTGASRPLAWRPWRRPIR